MLKSLKQHKLSHSEITVTLKYTAIPFHLVSVIYTTLFTFQQNYES